MVEFLGARTISTEPRLYYVLWLSEAKKQKIESFSRIDT